MDESDLIHSRTIFVAMDSTLSNANRPPVMWRNEEVEGEMGNLRNAQFSGLSAKARQPPTAAGVGLCPLTLADRSIALPEEPGHFAVFAPESVADDTRIAPHQLSTIVCG